MGLAAAYTRPGNPAEVLKLIDVDTPQAGPGQVVVRVTAFPIHPGDLQAIERSHESNRPMRAGIEATGVVDQIGADVTSLAVGQRVTVFPAPGAWCERITVDAEFAVAVPDAVPDDVAAQMLVNPITVLMLRREAEKHYATGYDGVVLNNAAGGAVGRLLTAVFDFHRIATISIVRSTEGAVRLRERFPAVPVVATDRGDWTVTVRELIAGRPVTAALDPIGGQLGGDLLRLLSPGGMLVSYGQMAPEPLALHASDVLATGLTVRGLTIGRWAETSSPEQRASDTRTAALIAQALPGQFDVARVYGLAELSSAVDHVNRAGKIGTIIVRP
jgi:NADPH:quinone reductase-like Zn-dependent oxidoreductase